MPFNSIDFAIFLPIVFLLYWFGVRKNIRYQNFLLVLASYFFYGCWDWRFLSLIIFSTIVDYAVGLGLSQQKSQFKRKTLLWLSILVNLGFLGFFKYYNFFLDNFVAVFRIFGRTIEGESLSIVLPVGISFYTFQTLSYSIDVYKGKIQPTRDIVAFAAFVSFFPQLVAGPIERARNLLPQFSIKRKFVYSNAVDGMRQILWGLFKKIVIADGCAEYANLIFNNSADYSGSTLILGAVFFAFQIYGDFSGYSDIAIGTARLFGFELLKNFSFPYFSRDIGEFWRRWHISLSTWFRDYLYIPLGGSRSGRWQTIRNVFIIFIVSGFWHGAKWTFVFWGALNALYFLPLLLAKKNRLNLDIVAKNRVLPSGREFGSMVLTFGLTTFAWIFFRAEDLTHATNYVLEIFSTSLLSIPEFTGMKRALWTLFLVGVFMFIEWKGREGEHALANMKVTLSRSSRWLSYTTLVMCIYFFGSFSEKIEFIYFQF